MPDEVKSFKIEDARIIFRNFAGREDKFNREGDRNFAVILPEDLAAQLLADGWNVRALASREEGDPDTPYIPVAVSFKVRPPRVVMITSTAQTNLSEDTIEVLDWAEIRLVDLICRGYDWEVNGKSGTKAYLQTLFVTIEEDDLERKYGINDPHQ